MFCSNASKVLFWNRILTRIQLFDVLKTSILIAKGFSISNTLIIFTMYYLGAITYSVWFKNIIKSSKLQINISTILRTLYYLSFLLDSNLIIFSLFSIFLGFSDTINNTNTESYTYQIFKDKYTHNMSKIYSISIFGAIIFNLVMSSLAFVSILIPIISITIINIINLLLGLKLPDGFVTSSNKTPFHIQIENFRIILKLEGIKEILFLLLNIKIYTMLLIRIKPYLLTATLMNPITISNIETASQIFPAIVVLINIKHSNMSRNINIGCILSLSLVILSNLIDPIYLLPYICLTSIIHVTTLPLIIQKIGDILSKNDDTISVLNIVELITNIILFPILLIISNLFQTKPYNEGYIYCVPFILLTIYFNYKFNIKSIAFPNVKSNLVEQKLKKVVN